jgi:penicillin-binding protein 1A
MKAKLKIALLALILLAVGGFSWLWFAPCGLGGCAPVGELERFQAEGSELLDVRDRPFGTLATVNRRVVPIDSLPEFLPQAFLAVEDRRFYSHGGVDWKRFMGALVSNVRAGGVAEGGSTITMQLARNLFPEHLPYRERSFRRKAMEVRVARQIERAFDKKKILELYLNHIYLGEGAYGVEAASRVYFGKSAAELSLAEAAVLGGLPVSPSRINPREDREASRERRDLVLREMAKAGFVTQAQADEAIGLPIRLARGPADRGAPKGSYFVERVRRELEEQLGDRFYTEGMKVYTTFDPAAQAAAEEEVARQADAIEAGQFGAYRHPTYPEAKGETEDGATPYLQAMAVVMEAKTGEIRALVGGRDFADSKYDRAFQARRQPGSAFKPFVYLAALERGTPPTEIFEDAPVRMVLAGGQTWEPRNYTGRFDGPMTMREALTRSKNAVTVRVSETVGMPTVARTARELGLTGDISTAPSAALGAGEVRPVELVGAYAAFANGGTGVTPHVIRRVESRDGEVLWEASDEGRQVLEPEVAFVLTSMLRDVVDRGTGTPVRAAGFRGPAAGKTGTTNAATDIWFVGYTPDLVGAVWFGLDRPQTIVRGASGGTIAAPVWGRIMSRIYRTRRAPLEWAPPRGVVSEVVDRRTGAPVDAGCPGSGESYTEYFVGVRPPRPFCDPGYPYDGVMAMGDSAWVYSDSAWADDEAWGSEYEPDTVGMSDLQRRGIDWPELEAQRRRGDAPDAPLPGTVEPAPPAGSGRTLPPPPPITVDEPEPVTGDDGAPVGGDEPAPPRREPRLLGRPTEGTGSEPAPAPTPPDTTDGA